MKTPTKSKKVRRTILVLNNTGEIPKNAVYMTSIKRSMGRQIGDIVEHYYELHTELPAPKHK